MEISGRVLPWNPCPTPPCAAPPAAPLRAVCGTRLLCGGAALPWRARIICLLDFCEQLVAAQGGGHAGGYRGASDGVWRDFPGQLAPPCRYPPRDWTHGGPVLRPRAPFLWAPRPVATWRCSSPSPPPPSQLCSSLGMGSREPPGGLSYGAIWSPAM